MTRSRALIVAGALALSAWAGSSLASTRDPAAAPQLSGLDSPRRICPAMAATRPQPEVKPIARGGRQAQRVELALRQLIANGRPRPAAS